MIELRISEKDELREFQKRTESNEELESEFDSLWDTIVNNFNTVNNELTLSGFLAVHEAQLSGAHENEFHALFEGNFQFFWTFHMYRKIFQENKKKLLDSAQV